jgi:hypothetical protein
MMQLPMCDSKAGENRRHIVQCETTANDPSSHFSFDADAGADAQKECRTTANISERHERLAKPRAT